MKQRLLALLLGVALSFSVYASLETGDFLDDLVVTNPTGSDDYATADDHLRLIKKVLTQSFPNIDAAVTSSVAELNLTDGLTASTAELNLLDGVTSTTAELNLVDGITAIQEANATLDELAALANTDSNFIVGNGSAWVAESGATARTSMGADSAANLTTGELPDARLSSNVPLINAANVFTNPNQEIQGNGASLFLDSPDGAADEDVWLIQNIGSTGQFRVATRTDAGGVGANAITMERTGTTIDEIQLDATALDFNGNADISGTLDVGSTVTHGGVEATHETGSYTGVVIGCTTDPGPTITWSKAGNIATVSIPSFSCTSRRI